MELRFEKVYYEEKKELKVQRSEVERYRGYLIIEEYEDGQCKIVKPAQIKVTIITEKSQKLTFNATEKIMALYSGMGNLLEIFEIFEYDATHNKLKFSLSEHGSLIIQ